jgi:hypothetical protein
MASPPSSPLSRQSSKTQSYVYPIKSLLSGRIQPAVDLSPQADEHSNTFTDLDLGIRKRELPRSVSHPARHRGNFTRKDGHLTFEDEGNNTSNSVTSSSKSPMIVSSRHRRRTKSDSRPVAEDYPFLPRHHGRNASPNFRHFPAEQDDADRPRSFCSTSALVSGPASPPLSSIATIAVGSEEEALVASSSLTSLGTDRDKLLLAPSTSADTSLTSKAVPPLDQKAVGPDLPFNPSEYGIVHLPPLPLSPSFKINKLSASDPNYSLEGSSYRSNSPSNGSTSQLRMASPPSFFPEPLNSPGAVSEFQSESFASSYIDPLVTFRFQHAEDEHGNHVVIGREGKLERCEDEVSILFVGI